MRLLKSRIPDTYKMIELFQYGQHNHLQLQGDNSTRSYGFNPGAGGEEMSTASECLLNKTKMDLSSFAIKLR